MNFLPKPFYRFTPTKNGVCIYLLLHRNTLQGKSMNCTIYTMDINNKVFHLNLLGTSSIKPRPFIDFDVGLNDTHDQTSHFVLDIDSITNIFVTYF